MANMNQTGLDDLIDINAFDFESIKFILNKSKMHENVERS